MKDDAANTVVGILIASEVQRRNDEIAREQDYRNNQLAGKNESLLDQARQDKKQATKLRAEVDDLDDDLQLLRVQNRQLFEKTRELQVDLERNKLIQAEWMVSQKAFKALAIELGEKLSIPCEEIIRMGNEHKLSVLDNKFSPDYGANAEDATTISNRLGAVREIVLAKLSRT